MAIELIYVELLIILNLIMIIFGFLDRIFFIFDLLINGIGTMSILADGSIVMNEVYNPNTATWIQYTSSILTSNNVPTLPVLVLYGEFIICIMLLVVSMIGNNQ